MPTLVAEIALDDGPMTDRGLATEVAKHRVPLGVLVLVVIRNFVVSRSIPTSFVSLCCDKHGIWCQPYRVLGFTDSVNEPSLPVWTYWSLSRNSSGSMKFDGLRFFRLPSSGAKIPRAGFSGCSAATGRFAIQI